MMGERLTQLISGSKFGEVVLSFSIVLLVVLSFVSHTSAKNDQLVKLHLFNLPQQTFNAQLSCANAFICWAFFSEQ